MGNIRPTFIKLRAIRLCEEHGEKFTNDFDHNKKIVEELNSVQGSSVDIGGYYRPNEERASQVMRPSATLNAIFA